MKVAITGSSGFVGSNLVSSFIANSIDFICIDRFPLDPLVVSRPCQFFVDYADITRLVNLLKDVDCVVHLAGRAHKPVQNDESAFQEFKQANVEVLACVVKASQAVSVKRIIYVSSIGVLGSNTPNTPFTDFTSPSPSALYGHSKLEAERFLVSYLSNDFSIDWVILRPPLIYGPNCPGNMSRLLRILPYLPLIPFASLSSQKSFMSIDNFIDILNLCLSSSVVSRKTFVVSDNDDISVGDLFAVLLSGLRISSRRLVPFPPAILALVMRIFGLSALWQQISSPLVIDSSNFSSSTGWFPRFSSRNQLYVTARSFLRNKKY
ncbi:Nucleoside-diphosphate-sugar epimerase [Synechococcus sp. RCC307]|nr:Nucleoside-diphosphate-sugar epimerase [Synechococcus sp. RCC307]